MTIRQGSRCNASPGTFWIDDWSEEVTMDGVAKGIHAKMRAHVVVIHIEATIELSLSPTLKCLQPLRQHNAPSA